MKDTGMARKVDDLGRIVLPVELRRLHDIKTGDALEISVDGDAIILRKLTTQCVFCGSGDQLTSYRGRPLCETCQGELAPPTPPPLAANPLAATPLAASL